MLLNLKKRTYGINNFSMKKIAVLTLIFCFLKCSVYCQKTASDYIAVKLANARFGDSCFSGFYYIKFSIGKNNKTKDIQFSSTMPVVLQSCIEEQLDSSLRFLDRSFLESASLKSKQLLIPVLCIYNLDCKLKSSKFLDELNIRSTGTEQFKYNLLNVIILGLLNSQQNLKTSFEKSMNFESEKFESYFDGIVLDPCLIIQNQKQGAKY